MFPKVPLLLALLAEPAFGYISNLPLSPAPQLRSSTSNHGFRPSVGPALQLRDFRQTLLSAAVTERKTDGEDGQTAAQFEERKTKTRKVRT
eukprot:3558342-Rhodomonas_salina.2